MATITNRLSSKIDKDTARQEIMMRFRHGKVDQYAKTHIYVLPQYFVNGEIVLKARLLTDEVKHTQFALGQLSRLCAHVQEVFQNTDTATINGKDWLQDIVDRFTYPEKYEKQDSEKDRKTFFAAYDEFLSLKKFSISRERHYKVLRGMLQRFELYRGFSLNLDDISENTLREFDKFIRIEHTFFKEDKEGIKRPIAKYRKIYGLDPQTRIPVERSDNHIRSLFKMLRAFILWCNKMDYTSNNPFKKFTISAEVYGTPYYITTEERDKIYNTDLSSRPGLERQRDVFVFQCFIGCRVSDLYSFTESNLKQDERGLAIEYMPSKTIEENPQVVKVYLTDTARAILDKYKDLRPASILPLISKQKYNDAIKEVFTACEITRMVTVLNPLTGKQEQKPINEVASSHMARRTFIGNLYKKVKDPNLVGKLSGHKEGSAAFARYRDIDDDMIKDLTNLL